MSTTQLASPPPPRRRLYIASLSETAAGHLQSVGGPSCLLLSTQLCLLGLFSADEARGPLSSVAVVGFVYGTGNFFYGQPAGISTKEILPRIDCFDVV